MNDAKLDNGGDQEDLSLRDLIARLIDSAKAYLRAEVALVKKTVEVRLDQAKPAAVFAIGAVMIVQAALVVLLAALGMGLATWLGTAGGLAVAGLVGLLVSGLLVWLAISRFTGSKDTAGE
ncbi:phage holin family protein [Sphingomonas sp. MMS24-J13]|uniref:phage holin family protein n=1 Tax=Sphingomonas sp. MMS24-J13 TaxID=3238686 RepID=UPI0038506A4A